MGVFTTFKEAVVGDDSEGGEEPANSLDRPTVPDESASENWSGASCPSAADFVVATGQTPNEALLELVEAREGRVKQAELVELTGWSKATVSRRLGELEDEGAIDRIRVGRCKVVLLPDDSLLSERAVSYGTRR